MGAFAKLRKATSSISMPVCLYIWNNSAPTGWIFMKSDIWVFFENLSRKFMFHFKKWVLYVKTCCTFMIISHWILLRMRNILDKCCRQNQNTQPMFSNFFFRKLCHLWDDVKNYGRVRETTANNIMWHMHIPQNSVLWGPQHTVKLSKLLWIQPFCGPNISYKYQLVRSVTPLESVKDACRTWVK